MMESYLLPSHYFNMFSFHCPCSEDRFVTSVCSSKNFLDGFEWSGKREVVLNGFMGPESDFGDFKGRTDS